MLKSKLSSILEIFITFNLGFCECFMKPAEISSISSALHDIADKFLVKQSLPFDIIILVPFSDTSSDILLNFLSKTQDSISYELVIYPGIPQSAFVETSAIIFVETVDILTQYLYTVGFVRSGNNPISIFIYIADSSYFDIENCKMIQRFKKISPLTASIFYHAFFIINEGDFVTLSTVEWFGKVCNQAHLTRVNTFNKITQKWSQELKFYEKFMNFRGCQLVMMLPMKYKGNKIHNFFWGFGDLDSNQSWYDIYGLTPEIFETAAKKHNFTAVYQPTKMGALKWLETFNPETITYLVIDNVFNEPNVVFFVYSLTDLSNKALRITNTFEEVKILVVTTPADAYTPYEKLLLPFDTETWILLIVTFLVTFVTIIVINKLSKRAQNIVYGNQVETPIWNVISIFFGVSQTKLPTENFSRFILTLFIVFCLIFRTCFQSKSFEYMTTEPRRAPPKTPQDLIDRNYSIMVINFPDTETSHSLIYDLALAEKEKWPPIKSLTDDEEHLLVNTQSQNSSAKIALLVDDVQLTCYDTQNKGQDPWNQLDDRFSAFNVGIATQHSSFYFRMIKDTVDRLIDTGIIRHLITTRVLIRIKYPQDEPEPKILNIDDLLFGFNIFLGFCGISGLIFVVELILGTLVCRKNLSFHLLRKKLRNKKIKFAKVHPINTIVSLICFKHQKLSLELIRKFKVKKIDCKIIDLVEDLGLFGEKVIDLEEES